MSQVEATLEFLRGQPTLTLFLVLGLGYLLGRLRVGRMDLGAVSGTLLVAIVLGRFGFKITPGAQAVGFALFIFAVGHQAGPHFVTILKTHGLRYLVLTIVVAAIGVATAAGASALLQLSRGGLAGLLSGALTATPMLAAAQDAVRSGLSKVPAGLTAENVLTEMVAIYAITYLVGTMAVIAAIKVLPRIAGVDLAADARLVQSSGEPVGTSAPAARPAQGDDARAAQTDMLGFCFGIALGSAVGLLSVRIGGVSVGLGTAGGLLAAGIAVGWLSSRRPTMGRFPEAARWILMELGLLIFICGVGLQAGTGIVETFRSAGPALLVAAAFVVVLPILGGYVFGRRVLGLPPSLLMGALAGATTSGPALGMLVKEAGSSVPALGYAGTYAIGSVLFTLIGTLLMTL
jgi:AspT/YidE/YbjL antiporter-like protein